MFTKHDKKIEVTLSDEHKGALPSLFEVACVAGVVLLFYAVVVLRP